MSIISHRSKSCSTEKEFFIEEVITFALACWMACAICIGLLVAAVAGVAYGYNYSMAEFMTFTKSDITVYMRRGQFYDQPDVRPDIFRRSGGDAGIDDNTADVLPVHEEGQITQDQLPPQVSNVGAQLGDSWNKVHDTRKYAQMLTQYSKSTWATDSTDARRDMFSEMHVSPNYKAPFQATREHQPVSNKVGSLEKGVLPISMSPNYIVSTTVWQSGSSQIVMRRFKPIENVSPARTARIKEYVTREFTEKADYAYEYAPDYPGIPEKPRKVTKYKTYDPSTPYKLLDKTFDDQPSRSSSAIPMRYFGVTNTPVFQEYPGEEVDENNIVYKPG